MSSMTINLTECFESIKNLMRSRFELSEIEIHFKSEVPEMYCAYITVENVMYEYSSHTPLPEEALRELIHLLEMKHEVEHE